MPDTAMSSPLAGAQPLDMTIRGAVGPQGRATDAGREHAADLNACEHLMRGGSKSFFAASRVLPARVRAPAIALYAFCRVADDEIDLAADPAAAVIRLDDRLDRIYSGRPLPIEADRALAAVVARFAMPRGLLDALIEGFRWDADGRRYETLDEVHDYCARVAGTVGAMMAILMGTRSRTALARACELGAAMQLTNIARDVGEDARNGRLYLPRAWLREEGLDPDAWLQAPSFQPAIGRVVARLLAEADRLYCRALSGIAELPRDCRPAIQAARLVYAEIGREVERAKLDSVSRRAVVSARRKLLLMARALPARVYLPRPAAEADRDPEALPAIRYLIDLGAVSLPADPPWAAPTSFYARTVWVIGLCERQRQRERFTLGAVRS